MAELKEGCVKPAKGPILPKSESAGSAEGATSVKEVAKMIAKVGKEAIDFEVNAWITGKGFAPVKLSDYKGKWIVVCFYPGDFTFV